MAGIRYCRICGKPYEYCKTNVPAGVNRWQDVACCIEHANEYFKQIAISRGEDVVEESEPTNVTVGNESDTFEETEDLSDEIIFENEDDDDNDYIEDDSEYDSDNEE